MHRFAARARVDLFEFFEYPRLVGRRDADTGVGHLKRDHEFLLQGEVFTEDVIDTWIWYKREREVEALRTRPHPYEFVMYYDV